MRAEVGDARVGDRVDRRHDREVVAARGVDGRPRRPRAPPASRASPPAGRPWSTTGCAARPRRGAARSGRAAGRARRARGRAGRRRARAGAGRWPACPPRSAARAPRASRAATASCSAIVEPHAAAARRLAPPRAAASGSESRPAEWRESRRWSFTSKVKPGGVSSAQRRTWADARDGVERRVDLHALEALRVPGQAVAGGQVRRVPLGHEAGIGPARGSHHDSSHATLLPGYVRPGCPTCCRRRGSTWSCSIRSRARVLATGANPNGHAVGAGLPASTPRCCTPS